MTHSIFIPFMLRHFVNISFFILRLINPVPFHFLTISRSLITSLLPRWLRTMMYCSSSLSHAVLLWRCFISWALTHFSFVSFFLFGSSSSSPSSSSSSCSFEMISLPLFLPPSFPYFLLLSLLPSLSTSLPHSLPSSPSPSPPHPPLPSSPSPSLAPSLPNCGVIWCWQISWFYRTAGKFGGEFNLAVCRSPTAPPNLISAKFLDGRLIWIAYPHARIT